MEPYLTRIGDVTIERVQPRNKDSVKESLLPQHTESSEIEEQKDSIEDEPIVENEEEKKMEEDPAFTISPEKFNDEKPLEEGEKKLDVLKEKEAIEEKEEGEVNEEEISESLSKNDEAEANEDSVNPESFIPNADEKTAEGSDEMGPDYGEGGTKRKTEDRGSDGEQKQKKKRQRKSSGKEGEIEDSSDSDSSDSHDSKSDKDNKEEDGGGKKKVDRKLTNLRRNIREVMNESELDEETKAAQRQEMERLRRVQEQQKIIRDLQRQIMLQNKAKGRLMNLPNSSSLLRQCTITTTGGSSGQSSSQSSSSGPSSSSTGNQVRIPSSVLMKLAAAGGAEANKKVIEMLTSRKRTSPRPAGSGQEQSLGLTAGVEGDTDDDDDIGASVSIISSRRNSIPLSEELVSDTDDEAEEGDDDDIGLYSDSEDIITVVPRKDPLPMDRTSILPTDSKPKGKDVVTISSSSEDDCMILSGASGEESEPEDTTNSGMHTNDLFNVPDENGNVLINVGHPSDEQDIFLAPQIARVIKPHQIGGLRFLYDNVVESLDRYKNSPGFGCILAHSMGLGKTLQVIAFCDVFLRTTSARTVLCIMPINTLQNWVAEFNLWMPADPQSTPLAAGGEVWPRQFPLHVLNDSHKSLSARTKVIREWNRNGGILLIGYELYRQLSLKHDKMRGRKKKRNMPEIMDIPEDGRNKQLWDDVHEALVKPGPDLVICDEGHRIKNSHASISHALKSIASKRRVVLTGYPLQNNLLEYWCMVDFVRPNYLGSKTEFCNMFERPIQNGQCIDSTPQDIRLMRYRAHVLHSLLEGFVQRRSHAVLQHTLPQKNEYVLLLRMTPFQRTLYDKFMNDVVRTKTVPNPLKAFSVCCKIWNHPDILYYFLKKQEVEDVDLDLEETAAAAVPGAVPGVLGSTSELCKKLTPGRPSGKGRPRLNAANKKEKLLKPAASINPTQPTKVEGDKIIDGTKSDMDSVQPPTTQGSTTTPSQASLYPSFPNNYPNQYYDQPGYSDQQYPPQQPPYQDYYNQPYPNNPGQYYPDQYNSNNSAQSGYYPQSSSQNYNNQSYWSSGNYNQDGQTNYNATQQNNYSQQQQPQQQSNPPQNSSSTSTPYYSNATSNYPNLMKPNSEPTFPLPPRIPNEGSGYNNDYPQPSYPYTNTQQPQQNNTDAAYSGYNQSTNPAPVEETKVNDVKPETTVAKEEIKEVVEEKPDIEVKAVVNDEVKVEDVVEKKENEKEIKPDISEDLTDETSRKPPPASAIEVGDLPPEGIRVPVRLEGKSMLEIGTNAYRASREEPSIPYDWATELLKGYEPGHLENCAKMEVFFCILEESMALGDRILLFSQSLFTLNLIEDFLSKTNLPGTEEKWARNVSYYRLDGSTSALDREKLINEYNSNPKIHLFLVSTRAGSLGINLVGANRVIVFDASWNPCHDTQAVCRVYRYGQRKPCFVYRLVMDKCLEKKIYDRQINKQGMADRVVDELNPDAHLSIREVSNLLYDSEPDTEIQDFNDRKDKYIDVVVQKLIERLSTKLSKEPFQHESLLVDRKEKKLSQAERRLAKRNYELEKQATLQPKYSNYSMGPQGTVGVGTLPGNSASGLQIRPIRMDGAKPIASVRPMQAEQGNSLPGPRGQVSSGPGRGRWIPAEVWQRQGMSAQEMTLPLDVVIPTNSPDRASIVLKAGQRVMVLKSPKGIYMQLENGKIIAIRTALKMGENRKPGTADNKIGNTSTISSLLSDKKLPIIDGKDSTSPILGSKMSQQKPIFPLKSNSEITITPRGPSTTMKSSLNSTATIPPNPKTFGTHDHAMPSSSVWRNEQRVQPNTKTIPPRSALSNNQSFSGPTKPFYHQHQESTHRNSATVAPEMKDTSSIFDTQRDYNTSSTNYQSSKPSQQQQSNNYPNQYSRNDNYNRSNTNYNSSSNYTTQNNAQNTIPETNNLQQQRHSMDTHNVMQQAHSMQRSPGIPVTHSSMTHSSSSHHHTPMTTLNIPNPTMSHQHHKSHTISHRPTSNSLSHTPQIQSLPPTNPTVQQISGSKSKNISEDMKSKSKPKPKLNKPETDPFNFQDDGSKIQNKNSDYYENKTSSSSDKPSDYNHYQQYNDYYNSQPQQQQPYGMGYQSSTQYTPEKNSGSKKEEKKKTDKSSTEFPVTTTSYSSTPFTSASIITTTSQQAPFNTTSGGSIVTTPQTSTYPDPYSSSQYGSSNYRYPPSSSSTFPTSAYPNQFSSDSTSTSSSTTNNNNASSTSSLYSAFHRPEPVQLSSGLPSSDVTSFLSHPFGLPSTAPHFPSTASPSSTPSPYYPQNVYPPTPSSYGRSPYPATSVDPYHAYPSGFNPFLVPTSPTSHYPLPTNPPNSTDSQSQ